MDKAPCKDCKDRYTACHNSCVRHLKVDFMNKHRNDVKKREYDYIDYKVKLVIKSKKKRNA